MLPFPASFSVIMSFIDKGKKRFLTKLLIIELEPGYTDDYLANCATIINIVDIFHFAVNWVGHWLWHSG